MSPAVPLVIRITPACPGIWYARSVDPDEPTLAMEGPSPWEALMALLMTIGWRPPVTHVILDRGKA